MHKENTGKERKEKKERKKKTGIEGKERYEEKKKPQEFEGKKNGK